MIAQFLRTRYMRYFLFFCFTDAIGKKATSAKLKILNINGATKLVKGYNGPLLSNGIIENWLSGMVSPTDKVLHESVVETLSNFLPPPKYLQPGRILQNGVFVGKEIRCSS